MVDEDCGVSSGDEDARGRFFYSAPSKRAVETEWTECAIPVDAREADGVASRKAGLKQGLGDSEPIFTLFTWFFPLQMFAEHISELDKRKPGPASSRHYIPWNIGYFLRFLGILIRTAIMPVPNMEWNWRWPSHLPTLEGFGSAKQWMSEVVFMRYWKYACIPGIYGGIEDNEIDEDGRTGVYQALKILL